MAQIRPPLDRAASFQAADAPLLAVDTDLVIRDVNAAYLDATSRSYEELVGSAIFEAFPDDPADPAATGVANLSASLETVFRTVRRHRMSLQRYDIRVDGPGSPFVCRYWTPVNTPLVDGAGRLVGALHHVEDVTRVVEAFGQEPPGKPTGPQLDESAWLSVLVALTRETAAHAQTRRTADQLQQALTSRVLVEQAKGMIAARSGISVDQAFARLRRHATDHGARLHDVARAVVELGLSV